jgi:N-terminal domain of anti-restriction factor ArdC
MPKYSTTTRRDLYQDITDRIVAAIEAGTSPWRRPWDPDKCGGPAMPRNAVFGHRYRGINVITLGMLAAGRSGGDVAPSLSRPPRYHRAHRRIAAETRAILAPHLSPVPHQILVDTSSQNCVAKRKS